MKHGRHLLVTGADGFIGKNLVVRLKESNDVALSTFVRGDDPARLANLVASADAVVHLAGENRPTDKAAFEEVNAGLTRMLCDAIKQTHAATGRYVPLLLASSVQAEHDNHYGRSKLAAEHAVESLEASIGNPCAIFRLPGVFGKWCRPNYNSVVATFCHNISRGLPIQVSNVDAQVNLVYVDDVISSFIDLLETPFLGCVNATVKPAHAVRLGDLADQITAFKDCRTNLLSERVGTGLIRALYATYVSYLPVTDFSYEIPQHGDARGVFVEMLKTKDSGQFSYFTAHPGITRGGHYHHTKTEKFLVIKGQALFRFRHLLTNELVELQTSGDKPQVVDTIPGWSHDITNIGETEMAVMLWANENFDRHKPDTVASKV